MIFLIPTVGELIAIGIPRDDLIHDREKAADQKGGFFYCVTDADIYCQYR